jgi:hypothetical protein
MRCTRFQPRSRRICRRRPAHRRGHGAGGGARVGPLAGPQGKPGGEVALKGGGYGGCGHTGCIGRRCTGELRREEQRGGYGGRVIMGATMFMR